MVLGQLRAVLVGTWWYWVRIGRYWLLHGDAGSVEGCTGCYLVVLGQLRAVLVGIWWYWVSVGRC